jgi:putative two-component system response regulator
MISGKPVVMVVEDDAEMNELQRELLAIHGMESVPAYTGTEAIELSRSCQADAILLDIMLPEMDGFETCEYLRQNENSTIPIIMLTALDSPECRLQGFAAGADAYFVKPFDPDEVVSMLRSLMAESK